MSEMTVLEPLPLPSLLRVRGWRQYYQSWLRALLSPGVRSDVLEEIRGRVRRGGEVEASCRCGAIRLLSLDAPRQVAVCHCSVCRYDEALSLGQEEGQEEGQEGGQEEGQEEVPGPCFATVRRDQCRLLGEFSVVAPSLTDCPQ